MINSTQQSVILIALATSALITIKDKELLPELKDVVDAGVERMLKIIEEYPADCSKDFSNTNEIMKRVSQLINKPNSWFSVETVAFLGNRVCSDLLGELCNPRKRDLVLEALTINRAIDDFLDPNGENEEAFNEVEEILKEVYKEIGFVQEHRFFKLQRKRQRRLRNHGRTSC